MVTHILTVQLRSLQYSYSLKDIDFNQSSMLKVQFLFLFHLSLAENRLPTLEVPDNVTVTVNVPKTFRVSAYDPGDTVTYKLTNDGNGAIQIIETTGNITVTVNSNTPVTLK